MATKAERKYVSKNDQEEMLKAFYDGLEDNENTFVGHRFPDADEVDAESDSSDDDDNDEDNERDDGDEMEEEKECDIEDDSNCNNDVIPEEASTSSEGEKNKERQNNKNNEADNVHKEPARKQKFKNLDQVMNENNYLDIPGQPKKLFRYQEAKKNYEDQMVHQLGRHQIATTQSRRHIETCSRTTWTCKESPDIT